MALKPTAPKIFDDAKLQAMVEPFTVRVEKLRNGQRMPIPLPESEEAPGQGGGIGYDKQAVRDLEQFLVTQWSGGGYYDIKVTDAQGALLHWTPSWNIGEYPEKVPPPLQGVYNPTAAPAPSTKRINMPAFPNGFPSFQQMMPSQQPQYGYQQPYYPPLPPAPPIGSPAYQIWSGEVRERQESAELRALREENARREREAIEARHKAELERDRQANEARFAAQANTMTELRNMIASLTTAIQTGAQNKQQSPEMEALKLQLQQQQHQAEADRREREVERRERETRDMIREMQTASQKQIDAMSRQLESFQTALTSSNQNRQDPMVEMLREQVRQAADSIKEVSRNHANAMERLQTSMLAPRDILALAKESSAAADQVTDKLTNTFGRIFDLQAKAMETTLSLQPQGSPVVDMIRDGAGHMKDMAERYFGRAELQAKLQATQQEQLLEAQRDIAIAQVNAQAGLSGPPQAQIVNHQTAPQIVQPPTGGKRKKKAANANGTPAKKRLGRTDAEWFGPIETDINRLRESVAQFCESLKANTSGDPNDLEGVSPGEAAAYIAQGAVMVIQSGAVIPVMHDLLFEQRFGDFMDVVLPDAPEQYRVDVLNALIPLLRGEVGGGEGMTGEPDPEEAQASAADGSDDGDDNSDGQADGEGDDAPDGDGNADQDGVDGPARGVVPPVMRSVGPNGKPINPPRRT